ncbi:MAG: hypothetical protein PHW76_02390, partial [Alphaproteobacteria bacterium]|nr:hypothetical protein [Alphaproteobacteria bacterium]
GPIHMAAILQAPTVALFSGRSSPTWSRPPGPKVALRRRPYLTDLGVDEAVNAVKELGVAL